MSRFDNEPRCALRCGPNLDPANKSRDVGLWFAGPRNLSDLGSAAAKTPERSLFHRLFGQYLDIDAANPARSVLVQLFFRYRRPKSDRLLGIKIIPDTCLFWTVVREDDEAQARAYTPYLSKKPMLTHTGTTPSSTRGRILPQSRPVPHRFFASR